MAKVPDAIEIRAFTISSDMVTSDVIKTPDGVDFMEYLKRCRDDDKRDVERWVKLVADELRKDINEVDKYSYWRDNAIVIGFLLAYVSYIFVHVFK